LLFVVVGCADIRLSCTIIHTIPPQAAGGPSTFSGRRTCQGRPHLSGWRDLAVFGGRTSPFYTRGQIQLRNYCVTLSRQPSWPDFFCLHGVYLELRSSYAVHRMNGNYPEFSVKITPEKVDDPPPTRGGAVWKTVTRLTLPDFKDGILQPV
jgi:hypothetical protein